MTPPVFAARSEATIVQKKHRDRASRCPFCGCDGQRWMLSSGIRLFLLLWLALEFEGDRDGVQYGNGFAVLAAGDKVGH